MTNAEGRATTDATREFRQTVEAVNVARQARGDFAEAEPFLATLADRLAVVAPGLIERAALPRRFRSRWAKPAAKGRLGRSRGRLPPAAGR
jgi:hypothetical protein